MDYYDTDDVGDGYFERTPVRSSPYTPPLADENFGELAPVRRRVLLPVLLLTSAGRLFSLGPSPAAT